MADLLPRETWTLYGLPLSTFTAARNAGAKELKYDDRRAEEGAQRDLVRAAAAVEARRAV